MKNIYLVQTVNLYGANAHLPYTAGCIAAYAWSNPVIRENYNLGQFTFLRKPINQALEAFDNPFLVAFSNYVWNFEYHMALARAIKKRWPRCYILFGGHQILNNSCEQLNEYPFMDFLLHKEGEVPFEKLLLALLNGDDLNTVPSLSYRIADGTAVKTQQALPCKSKNCDFPSPYLTGLFDKLFEEYPHLVFSMTLETNRGCPHSCAFCDWGNVKNGLVLMPMERVKAEIDWAAAHKIEFLFCADGNFGILERDKEIIDYLTKTKSEKGWPEKFSACFTKNSNETVFELNKTLSEYGLNAGATLSFQSLSPITLENIGRKNLGFERFKELISLYNSANLAVYSELILGLPGETLESFTQGVGTLLDAGMHGSLEIFPCELLLNSRLASPEYMEKYGIEGIRVRQYQRHGSPENQDEVPEYSDFICKTSTMSKQDLVLANLFAAVMQGFHGLGMTTYIAVYLHVAKNLNYERFYFDVMDYAKANPTTMLGELLADFEQRYINFSKGDGASLMYYNPTFGEVTWPLGEAMFLRAAFDAKRFYEELPSFLKKYDIDADVFSELMRFQKTMVCLPAPPIAQQGFSFDFPSFFAAAFSGERPELKRKAFSMQFPSDLKIEDNWVDFARERVWYGRRKGCLSRNEYEVIYE